LTSPAIDSTLRSLDRDNSYFTHGPTAGRVARRKVTAVPVSPLDVERALRGIEYPATRAQLIERARANYAAWQVIDRFERLPEQSYGGPDDVLSAVVATK
jgi:hypothetical protein